MSIQRRHKNLFKNLENTGFGANSTIEGSRLTNKDGSTNLRKTGLPFWERISIYHTMLRMKRLHFALFIVLFYTSINLFFAIVYFLLGVQNLYGIEHAGSHFNQFMDAFFFSSQTLTTVGYGHIAPADMATNIVASTESLIGILVFALVTGLIYGRFARPMAYICFSHNLLVAPYKDGRALMLRLATYKNNHLTDAEAQITVAMHEADGDKKVTRFYTLPLEINKVGSLALSWTLVHNLNEDSPLYLFTEDDFKQTKMEIIVGVKGFDDHFSNIVQQRTSYTIDELVYGARFIPMFERSENGKRTLLLLDKINAYEKVTLAEPETNISDTGTMVANA